MPELFQLNGTFFIFAVLFFVFVYLFNEIALKPVGAVIEERKKLIQADLDAANRYKEQAQDMLHVYETRIRDTRHNAQEIIQAALLKSEEARNQALQHVQSEGHEQIEKVKGELRAERQSLKSGLVDSETELVQEIVRKLLGKSTSLTIDRKLVETALEEANVA